MPFDDQLERALDALTGRLQDEVARRVRLVGEEVAAAASQPDSATVAQDGAAARLAESVRAIGAAHSTLDTLVRCAGREAARAGVMLVAGDRSRGWRFVGFDPPFADPAKVGRLPSGTNSIALPIVIGGQKVAGLYADAGARV